MDTVEFQDLTEADQAIVDEMDPKHKRVHALAIYINGLRYIAVIIPRDGSLQTFFRSPKNRIHIVSWDSTEESCSCEDYEYRSRREDGTRCKHIATIAKLKLLPETTEYMKGRLRDLGGPDPDCLKATKVSEVPASCSPSGA